MSRIFLGYPPPKIKEFIVEHYGPKGPVFKEQTVITFSDGITEEYDWEGDLMTNASNSNLWQFGSWTKKLKTIIIGTKITKIGGWAFYNEKELTNVYIPDSVTTIESDAFEYNPLLKTIEIPKSVIEIQTGNFINSCTTSILFKGRTM